jgi:hypothetical protein
MKTLLALGAVTLMSAMYAAPARAACADPGALHAGLPNLSNAVYRSSEYGGTRIILAHNDQDEVAAIVGLWTFELRAKADPGIPNDNPGIPDGALLDFGLIQWHEDGTEITNSGGRTPAVGNVCMGAWKQVGPSTFKLKHLALGYGPPQGPVTGYQGVVLLEMTVRVDSGGHTYHGNFTLTQYMSKFDPTVPGSAFDQSTVEFTLSGTVKATRVEVN